MEQVHHHPLALTDMANGVHIPTYRSVVGKTLPSEMAEEAHTHTQRVCSPPKTSFTDPNYDRSSKNTSHLHRRLLSMPTSSGDKA